MGTGTAQGGSEMGTVVTTILAVFVLAIVNAIVIYTIMRQYIVEVREIDFRIMQSAYRLGKDTQEKFPLPSEGFEIVRKDGESVESAETNSGGVMKFRNNLRDRQRQYRRRQRMAGDILVTAAGPSVDPKTGGGGLEG